MIIYIYGNCVSYKQKKTTTNNNKSTNFTTAVYKSSNRKTYFCVLLLLQTRRYCLFSCYVYMYIYTYIYIHPYICIQTKNTYKIRRTEDKGGKSRTCNTKGKEYTRPLRNTQKRGKKLHPTRIGRQFIMPLL